MKLIYLNIGLSSVFESQVLSLLYYYVEHGLIDDVILLQGYKNKSEKELIKKKKIKKINVLFFKVYPNYSIFNFINFYNLNKVLKENINNFSDYHFHIRTELATFYLKNAINKFEINTNNVLPDIRGATFEEVKEYYGTNRMLLPFKLENYKIAIKNLKDFQKISVVSESLKNYILEKNSNIPTENIFVTQCLASEGFYFDEKMRKNIRSELKIKPKEILIVFASGGVNDWQKNEQILDLAAKGFKVLNLSKIKIDHENIITKFVSYTEVPGYLSASDVAFIWRDQSRVNEVASPVKVSEYLSCGLPIIHNNTIRMLQKLSRNRNLKFFSRDELELLSYRDIEIFIQGVDRFKISETGRSIFGIKSIVEKYLEIYNNR